MTANGFCHHKKCITVELHGLSVSQIDTQDSRIQESISLKERESGFGEEIKKAITENELDRIKPSGLKCSATKKNRLLAPILFIENRILLVPLHFSLPK